MSGVLDGLLEDEVVIDVEPNQEPTVEDKELALSVQVEDLKITMEAVTIKDAVEFEAACEWLKAVKKKTKEVESFYEPDKKMFYAKYKDIMDKTKKLTNILKVCESGVKAKIKEYTDAEEARQAEEQRKIEAERQKAIEDPATKTKEEGKETDLAHTDPLANVGPAPVIPAKKAGSNSAGVVMAKVWKWKITDETLIPREYFLLDEKKINGIVKAMKGDTKISGIEAYEDTQVRG